MSSPDGGFADTAPGQIILLCWVVFTVIWIANAAPTKQKLVSHGLRWWNIVPTASAGILLIVLHTGVADTFAFPRTTILGVIADVCAAAGIFVLIWARRELGSAWSATVTIRKDHPLVDTGPYAWVRHPIYSGMLLLCVGTILWIANGLAWLVFVIVTVSLWYKARSEEALLSEFFPEQYAAYQSRTKMMIPGIL